MQKVGFAFAALCLSVATANAGELRLTIANGRVTMVAQDVSVRQILDEWGRVGQTKVVGAERLTGPMVTMEFTDVPEGRALDAILRSASGYIAKPRLEGTVGVSAYDRILIMPASKAPAATAPPPTFNSPRPQPQVVMPNVVVDDDIEPGAVPPGVNSIPQPQPFPGPSSMPTGVQPAQPTQTLTKPGMLPPPNPNVPGGNPYQTTPPPQQPGIRPPGVPGGPGGGQ